MQRDASGSDVGLPIGTTYFVLETEEFTPTPARIKSRRTVSLTGQPPSQDPAPPGLHRKGSSTAGKRAAPSFLASSSLTTSPILERTDARQAFLPVAQNGAASDYFSRTVAPRRSSSALSATNPSAATSPSHLTSSSLPMPTPGRLIVLPTSEEPSSSPPPPDPLLAAPSTSPSPPALHQHARARTESSVSPHGEARPVAIPISSARSGRPPSVSSSSSVRHGSFGGPRSFNMAGSHLAKAPPTTASSTDAFDPLASSIMALPPSAAAAHLSKHSSSTDLVGGAPALYGASPGRMSFMSNLGLGKRRSTSELEPHNGGSGRE